MAQKGTFEELPTAVAELHQKIDDLTGRVAALLETKEAQDEKLLSATEACKLFIPAISRLTLIRWTKADYLKEHRIGGRVYYRLSEVIEGAKHLEKYKSKIDAGKGNKITDKSSR